MSSLKAIAFRRNQMAPLFLLFLTQLSSGASSGNATWCMTEESYDAYGVALKYLGVQSIQETQLDQLIQDVFGRLDCQQMALEGNFTCETCLEAGNIYTMLNLSPGSSLTEELFRNASTVVVSYLYDLRKSCLASKSLDWSQATYSNFTHILLSIPDDIDAANTLTAASPVYLTEHQLETLLRSISKEYFPGENYTAVSSCGLKTEAHVQNLCSFGNVRSFSSMNVESLTVPASPDQGIHEDELGRMNSIIFSKLLSGECISRVDEGHPVAEDFIRAIYQTYSEPGTCQISLHGLEEMASALSIGGSSHGDEHDDHLLPPENSRKKRETVVTQEETHSHSVDVKTACLTMEDILTSFGFEPETAFLSKTDFSRICPSLVQQATQGCPNAVSEPTTKPSTAETYGYGTASVFVTSVCAMLGLLITPWRRTRAYKYILTIMLGLGVGALTADAFLHLIPQALELHGHAPGESHGSVEVEPFVWKMLCTCLSIWAYYLLQLGLYSFGELMARHKVEVALDNISSPSVGRNNLAADLDEEMGSYSSKKKDMDSAPPENDDPIPASKEHDLPASVSSDLPEKDRSDAVSLEVHAHVSMAWMVTIGDGLHNFADGMAIGAAYTVNWQTGLSTTIAVFTHELPHEFGDVAMLLSTGWSTKKVFIFQMIAQCTAFVGLYVGISIAENAVGAQQWIFAVAAGMFIYVALADVIPELVEFYKRYSRLHIFLLSNAGIFLGYLALLLIAIFEDYIIIT